MSNVEMQLAGVILYLSLLVFLISESSVLVNGCEGEYRDSTLHICRVELVSHKSVVKIINVIVAPLQSEWLLLGREIHSYQEVLLFL